MNMSSKDFEAYNLKFIQYGGVHFQNLMFRITDNFLLNVSCSYQT